jgi:hypothetical protein
MAVKGEKTEAATTFAKTSGSMKRSRAAIRTPATQQPELSLTKMSLKAVSLFGLAALVLVALYMALVFSNARKPAPQRTAAVEPIAGKADFRAIDDLRVAGKKVVLCGVSFTRPTTARELALKAARDAFQGKNVTCRPVGSGTPCDGRAAASFRGALVGQCLTEDGRDMAAELAMQKVLCDLPSQSGGHYSAC